VAITIAVKVSQVGTDPRWTRRLSCGEMYSYSHSTALIMISKVHHEADGYLSKGLSVYVAIFEVTLLQICKE